MDTNDAQSVYIVTFDLQNKSRNYVALVDLIKGYNYYARLGESSFLISTSQSPVEVRTKLKQELDNGDKLFIGKITAPAAWTNMSGSVSDWIKKQLK